MSDKKGSSRKFISFSIVIIISAIIGYYVGRNGVHFIPPVPKLVKMWMIVLFIPAFFLVIGIHEAGHAITGILQKFDFKMYVVGPFMWEKESGGWRFKWNKNVNTAGGMVICLPTGSNNLANRFSLYALGGPFASLLLTITAYLLSTMITFKYGNSETSIGVAKYFLLMVSIFSCLIMLVTILPLQTGGFSSDGGRALRLLSGGDQARFEVLTLKIVSSSAGGIRPCLLDKSELEEAELLAMKTGAAMGVYISGVQHQAEFDGGSLDKAEEYLLTYIENADKIPDGLRNSVWLDAAFFYAFGRTDLEKSTIFWNKFQPSAMLAKAQILATEASILVLKAQNPEALEKIRASHEEIPNMMDKGVGIALVDKLNELEGRIIHV
ncbi:M50 family metallopeptidase [Daejeonella lutea]|uniref:Peptidase M50 domain-containing protein n=1 Tax=Daejeonella lutea TaxID=572036 RepID=A0A1T5A7S5_9SPHI|nr:M50 family metallopeptidase [Daejeonella lutea]SKB31082.1 hypothetical protein SAMN05661099_0425 [Daejeonella lutea]